MHEKYFLKSVFALTINICKVVSYLLHLILYQFYTFSKMSYRATPFTNMQNKV